MSSFKENISDFFGSFNKENLRKLFKMDGVIDKKLTLILNIIGVILLFSIWHLATKYGSFNTSILPKPMDVLRSFSELHTKYKLFSNIWFSVKINLIGYFEAVIISLVLGFSIGLSPLLRGLLVKCFDAMRFIPPTALNGLFVTMFGISIYMKAHFLAFGIIIYLVTVVVQRIDEVEKVHKQTLITLGANSWQKFKYVYFPSVISRVSDDIRILVAISWTYIISIEAFNQEGGIGALIQNMSKQTRYEMVYALLVTIIVIGYIQDMIFKYIDYLSFPYKYESSQQKTTFSSKFKLFFGKLKTVFVK